MTLYIITIITVEGFRAQELRESEFRSCVKVEVAVLGFPP